jgi:hypothetical protein
MFKNIFRRFMCLEADVKYLENQIGCRNTLSLFGVRTRPSITREIDAIKKYLDIEVVEISEDNRVIARKVASKKSEKKGSKK